MIDSIKSEASADLTAPVRYLKGVGPKRAELLERLDIRTLEDLIWRTPRAWEDRRLERPPVPESIQEELKDCFQQKNAAHLCQISGTREQISASGKIVIFKAQASLLEQKSGQSNAAWAGRITLTWIRRRSFKFDPLAKLKKDIKTGAVVLVCGRTEENNGFLDINVEDYLTVDFSALKDLSMQTPHWLRLIPVYPSTEGLNQGQLREMRWQALEMVGKYLPDWTWPENAEGPLKNLEGLANAYKAIHFPKSESELALSRRSIAGWELLLVSLAMEMRRRKTLGSAKPFHYKESTESGYFEKLKQRLGFHLTAGQSKAIDEILASMASPEPMNRLLQGEVGSGKTLVAVAALCKALESGHQAAFIAPTEILVFQHHLTLGRYLKPLGITIAALTSDTPEGKREEILRQAAAGKIDILLGTHSLLGPDVQFKSLALVIMDEQHRFGVKQRWTFRNKAHNPDCLVISATPIPRTLALALYGDLDITTMEDMPSGRQVAETILIKEEAPAWTHLRDRLKAGEQAYVVVPAIEEDETSPYSLEKEFKRISELFPQYPVGALHGQMPSEEKEATMARFSKGEYKILVATTVIEVGIDVPLASIVVILGAERFGLATLHQLRGRVGRGEAPGLCILVASQGALSSQEQLFTPTQALERLEEFSKTKSGFEIGKLDLLTRGPGKMLGLAQSGNWDFEHFDFQHYSDLIAPVRSLARSLAAKDTQLRSQPFLKSELKKRFGRQTQASDIS